MIVIDNTIISDIITEKHFSCDLASCCGACCIEGDEGAPLEKQEVEFLVSNIEKIKVYMTKPAISQIENSGLFSFDKEGNYVTPLLNGNECAYLYYEGEIAKCCIEKAFLNKKIKFQKPVSCHLYPIRITEYKDFTAINYHQWYICDEAVKSGKARNVLIYEYLKGPLIRKFGKKWYDKLDKEVKNNSLKHF
jgi:hypothetical protein